MDPKNFPCDPAEERPARMRMFEVWEGDHLLLVTSDRTAALEAATDPNDIVTSSTWIKEI